MAARSAFLVVVVALCAGGVSAQQKLGDFVTDGGYDWIIGRWAASADEGKIEVEYKWSLDKSVVLSGLKMGDYRNRGIIMLDAYGQVVETTADNKGGIWKGAWTDEGGNLVNHVEYTMANGEVHKGDVVYTKEDNDTVTIAMYGTDSNGSRNSEPMSKLTYKRQPAATAVSATSEGQSGQSTDYQKLGDLVAEGGYEWLAGKWLAAENDQKYLLEHSWTLDKHAMVVDLKMGDFVYHGMVIYRPVSQEITQIGADSMGGIWKGTWDQGEEGATHRVEYTRPDGTTRRMEHVYVKVDNDTFKVKEYPVTDGTRASETSRTLTFQRQKAPAETKQ